MTDKIEKYYFNMVATEFDYYNVLNLKKIP